MIDAKLQLSQVISSEEVKSKICVLEINLGGKGFSKGNLKRKLKCGTYSRSRFEDFSILQPPDQIETLNA